MAEVTRVPLQPIAKGSLLKLWLGVLVAVLVAAGVAWAAMPKGVSLETISAGEGESPQMGDVVFVKYTGKLEDGTVFDQSQDRGWPVPGILPEGAALLLQEDALIPGFVEGLGRMQRGGTYRLSIPADQAYGAEPPAGSPIPPNADLTFDIEVIDFMSEEEAQQRVQSMMMQMQQMEGMGGEGAVPGGAGPLPEGAGPPQ